MTIIKTNDHVNLALPLMLSCSLRATRGRIEIPDRGRVAVGRGAHQAIMPEVSRGVEVETKSASD